MFCFELQFSPSPAEHTIGCVLHFKIARYSVRVAGYKYIQKGKGRCVNTDPFRRITLQQHGTLERVLNIIGHLCTCGLLRVFPTLQKENIHATHPDHHILYDPG